MTHLTMRCPNFGAAAGRGGSDAILDPGGGPGGPLPTICCVMEYDRVAGGRHLRLAANVSFGHDQALILSK